MRTKIFGGPGCGKSTSLIKLMKESNLPFEKIAYVTFSRKALSDMKEKLKKDGKSEEDLRFFKTIHAMNFKLLNIKRDKVADYKLRDFCEKKGFRLSSNIIKDQFNRDGDEEFLLSFQKSLTLDDEFYKQMNKDRQDLRDFNFVHPIFRSYSKQFLHFKHSYFEWMKENDYIDFMGMIEQGIEQGVVPPVDLLCVDEWQDLNYLQIKQIISWSKNIETSFHAGDDDQCIHEYAGATPGVFLDFPCDNEKILNETFRLPSDILELSQLLITKNKKRRNKNITSSKGSGGIFVKNMTDTCDMIKQMGENETCFILVRNNFIKSGVWKSLKENGIPTRGLEKEKKALSFMLNNKNKNTFTREDIAIITEGSIFPATRYFKKGAKKNITNLLKNYTPDTGYEAEFLAKLGLKREFFSDLMLGTASHLNIDIDDSVYLQRVIREYGDKIPNISVMTIHQSKGLEADMVVLIPDKSKASFVSSTGDVKEMEAERRVWYTGITRTKKILIAVKDTNFSTYKSNIVANIEVFLNTLKNARI